MNVSYTFESGRVIFSFGLDKSDEERINGLRFGMNKTEVFVDLGPDFCASSTHPDLLALSALLIVNPFVGDSLTIDAPVSKEFIEGAQSVISKYKINSSSKEEIEPRTLQDNGVPALAFSGGADSVAALSVMPANTIPIFLNRISKSRTMYNPDAPLTICNLLKETGYRVMVVDSDLEHIREPVGFPTDLANSVPSILLVDKLGVNSVSFGTIMESGFGIGHQSFIEYSKGAHWRFFSSIFQSAGVHLSFPVIGVSEIGTAIIGSKSPVGFFSQSCIRGLWRDPCFSCWKCFRKELLSYGLGIIDDVNLLGMLDSNEVQIKLSAFPISHENVIVYSLQRIDLDLHPYLKPLADKVDMGANLEFLNSWYPPSIEFVPDNLRHSVRQTILKYLNVMTLKEEGLMRNWDMSPHLSSKRAISGQKKLTSFWQDVSTRFGT